jgi:hypothetical protein
MAAAHAVATHCPHALAPKVASEASVDASATVWLPPLLELQPSADASSAPANTRFIVAPLPATEDPTLHVHAGRA